MSTDLWPEFKIDTSRGMRQMLEDAGQGLEEKTGGVVKFRVSRPMQKGYGFRYECDLVVPSAQYSYPLIHVEAPASTFPATVVWGDGDSTEVNSESDLRRVLKDVFQSADTKQIVVNLVQNFGP